MLVAVALHWIISPRASTYALNLASAVTLFPCMIFHSICDLEGVNMLYARKGRSSAPTVISVIDRTTNHTIDHDQALLAAVILTPRNLFLS
jgi:hypothetical protein